MILLLTQFFYKQNLISKASKTRPEQLKSGKSLLGKDGALPPLLEKKYTGTQGEMEAHL